MTSRSTALSRNSSCAGSGGGGRSNSLSRSKVCRGKRMAQRRSTRRVQQCSHAFHNLVDRHQSPCSLVAAREHSFVRADKLNAAPFQGCDVLLRGSVLPHLSVHCRRKENSR